MYTWGAESTDAAAELSLDDFAFAVSELRFRSDLLSRFEEIQNIPTADFVADGSECLSISTIISTVLGDARAALQPFVDVLGPIGTLTNAIFTAIEKVLPNLGDLKIVIAPLSFALQAVQTILSTFAFIPGLVTPLTLINKLIDEVKQIVICLTGGNKLFFEASTCSTIADLYRIAVAETAKTNPALNLPESASADLRRLAAGSLSVLDLMGKNAIATTNEELLAIRPIFATDILNQFREELLRAESDDIKMYAKRDLSVVVGISNALEACLRVAADPVAAIDDLNEELEDVAQDYDDEDDNDDYEDDDYEDDDEEYETDGNPEQQQ